MSDNTGRQAEYLDLLSSVTNMFTDTWNESMKKIRGAKAKAYLKRFMPLVYRRWYFSTFTENTPLSPANLIMSLNKQFGYNELLTPRLVISPEDGAPVIEPMDFDGGRHPLIRDMLTFLDGLSPTYEAGFYEQKLPESLAALSLNDSEYLDFLSDLCVKLKLVSLMPSVKSEVGMINPSYLGFFDKTDDDILRKVVDFVVDTTFGALSAVLPLMPSFRDKLFSYIRRPEPTDEIFDDIFNSSGADVRKLVKDFTEEPMGPDILNRLLESSAEGGFGPELIMSTFFIGVELDRNFLTPLSYYLRVIQPLYILPMNIPEEMGCFNGMVSSTDTLGSLLYAPCSTFMATSLAERLYGPADIAPKKRGAAKKDTFLGGEQLSSVLSSLNELVEAKIQTLDVHADYGAFFSAKLSPENESGVWVNVRLSPSMTLEDLHEFITEIFDLDDIARYSFFVGEQTNPFSEYKPDGAKSRMTDSVTLADLGLALKSRMLYRPKSAVRRGSDTFDVGIVVMGVPGEKEDFVPRVSRRSKTYTERYGGEI